MSSPATLDALLAGVAAREAARPALTLDDADLDYRGLIAAADDLAAALAAGVAPGQRVGIIAPNVPALVVALVATWRLGGVAVPLSARYREHELRQILGDAELTAVVAVASHAGYSFVDLLGRLLGELPTVRRALLVDRWGRVTGEVAGVTGGAPAEPLDPTVAALLYTSGTTGEPKGVPVSHRRELATAAALGDVLGAAATGPAVLVVPLAHAFGLSCLLALLATAGRAVLVDSSFSPGPMLQAIDRHQAVLLHGSPALFAALHRATGDRSTSLRTGFVAGAPCPGTLLETLDGAGLRVLNLYGTTELGAATCCRPSDPPAARYATVGRPLPGYVVRVHQGELQVAGETVTPAYYRRPEQTAAAFDGAWFRTGDLATIDGTGYVTITGRAKEMVQVAGHSVSPAEVESLLLTHPDVVQAVVVGVAHPTMGEALRAVVVPRPGSALSPPALLQFARERIAGYKLPYAISLVERIPMLGSGKPDRRAVRRSLEEEHGAA